MQRDTILEGQKVNGERVHCCPYVNIGESHLCPFISPVPLCCAVKAGLELLKQKEAMPGRCTRQEVVVKR